MTKLSKKGSVLIYVFTFIIILLHNFKKGKYCLSKNFFQYFFDIGASIRIG